MGGKTILGIKIISQCYLRIDTMRAFKILLIVIVSGGVSVGGYLYYQHEYVRTLMLSEIVGHSDNKLANIFVNLADFDTELTRNDLRHLKKKKEYWINRINEVSAIDDPELQVEANLDLIEEMSEDPALKKIVKNISVFGMGFIINVFMALT